MSRICAVLLLALALALAGCGPRQASPPNRPQTDLPAYFAAPESHPREKEVTEEIVHPRPGQAKWKRYALVLGLREMARDRQAPLTAEKAQEILGYLRTVQKDDEANDHFLNLLLDTLTDKQVERLMADHRIPRGACTCPCTSWNPSMIRATKMLQAVIDKGEQREPPGRVGAGNRSGVSHLIILAGLGRMSPDDPLAPTPKQAEALKGVIDRLAFTLKDIEQQMLAVEKSLDERQSAYIEEAGKRLIDPEATAAALDDNWETWLQEAIDALEARA